MRVRIGSLGLWYLELDLESGVGVNAALPLGLRLDPGQNCSELQFSVCKNHHRACVLETARAGEHERSSVEAMVCATLSEWRFEGKAVSSVKVGRPKGFLGGREA